MTSRPDEEIDRALRFLQRAIVKHPIAAQAIYSALVREGRAYAETEEGRALRSRLAQSEVAMRVQTAWDIITLGMLDHQAAPGALPSVLIDAMIHSVFRARFEARLHRALRDRDA